MASPSDIAKEIERAIDGATSELSDSQLVEIGHQALNVMVTRTKAGLDADLRPFVPYSVDYANERAKRGYSTTPDLARTGHMLGAMIPLAEPGAVTIRFLSPMEEKIATFQNEGTNRRNASLSVRSHSRGVFVDKATGRRVSREEVARDRRRKNKRVMGRTENVSAHTRTGGVPQREFFDVRAPVEVAAIGESIGDAVQGNVEKKR